MTGPAVFAMALSEPEQVVLNRVLAPHASPVFSLYPMSPIRASELLMEYPSVGPRIQPIAQALRCPLPSQDSVGLESLLQEMPRSLLDWTTRNLVLMALTGTLFYLVNDVSTQSLDLTRHLVAARMLGVMSVGFIPSDLRLAVESTQLTYTDVLLGEEEHRVLSLLVRTLKRTEEVTRGGEAVSAAAHGASRPGS